jgi:hypothetical protein
VGETELATGYSVRVVDYAQDLLYSTLHYQRAAFIVGRFIVRRLVPSLITSTFSVRMDPS